MPSHDFPAVNGVTFPPDLRTSLTDGSDADAYPITGTTFALVYQHQTSPANAAGADQLLRLGADDRTEPVGGGQLRTARRRPAEAGGRPAEQDHDQRQAALP